MPTDSVRDGFAAAAAAHASYRAHDEGLTEHIVLMSQAEDMGTDLMDIASVYLQSASK
jgi:hypothetical protein